MDIFIGIFLRALLCIIGYIRNILNEQKKSDFKPESDLFISECSPVCGFVGISNSIRLRLNRFVNE
jgi:hypothetical protein